VRVEPQRNWAGVDVAGEVAFGLIKGFSLSTDGIKAGGEEVAGVTRGGTAFSPDGTGVEVGLKVLGKSEGCIGRGTNIEWIIAPAHNTIIIVNMDKANKGQQSWIGRGNFDTVQI
jgi:FAD/FMN-containing dehydrogenase